ncbi:MAG: TetR/AcrR family transcriptional regulator of autoinduction and epiphytic fitness [Clostridium sp.]|jgi:TetR/AcrR family transcriptional regulator of autoinduction and epiphytic fitness
MKRNRPLNQDKRESILAAAIEEFYTKGYEGSSMDTVSKEANVSKATVYNHFNNKEELFLAIATILKERFENSFDYIYSKETPLDIQLREIASKEMFFLNSEENIKLLRTVTIVMMQKNAIGLKILEMTKDECMLMTSKWFDDAKVDKKLTFKSSTFVSQQFIGMLKSFAFLPQIYGAPLLSEDEQNKVIDETVDMILKLYTK